MIPTSSTHRMRQPFRMVWLARSRVLCGQHTGHPTDACPKWNAVSPGSANSKASRHLSVPFRFRIPALKMQDAAQGFRATEVGTAGTTTSFPSASDCRRTLPRDGVGTPGFLQVCLLYQACWLWLQHGMRIWYAWSQVPLVQNTRPVTCRLI